MSSCDEDIPDDAPKVSVESSSTITRPQNIVDSNLQEKNESKASDKHCTDVDISVSQVSDGILSVSPLEENEALEHEEPGQKGIEINITPSNAKEYIRVHWDQIIRFGDTEKCIKLKEKVSLTKGDVEAFNIGTDIPEDINNAISQTIAEMGKTTKCKNFVANSHALYVYVVLSIFLDEQKTNNQHEQINMNQNLKTFLNYFKSEIDYIETDTETEKTHEKIMEQESEKIPEQTEKAHIETSENESDENPIPCSKKDRPSSSNDKQSSSNDSEEREREAFLNLRRKKQAMSDSTSKKTKMEISEKFLKEDWCPSTKYSRAEILGILYAFYPFIQNKNHQRHSRECMSRLRELLIENPKWGEKCCLEDSKWSDLSDTT